MVYQALVFDRDGVLTYFDVEAADRFFRSGFSISVYEVMRLWTEAGMATGFPATPDAEARLFEDVWPKLPIRTICHLNSTPNSRDLTTQALCADMQRWI